MVGARIATCLDPRGHGVGVAPGHQGVDQAVAQRPGVVVGEPSRFQFVRLDSEIPKPAATSVTRPGRLEPANAANLLVCGDWTHPWLPATMEGAAESAALAVAGVR